MQKISGRASESYGIPSILIKEVKMYRLDTVLLDLGGWIYIMLWYDK